MRGLRHALLGLALVGPPSLLGLPDLAQAQDLLVRDLVQVQGVSQTPITGYGLVVGLSGTGDRTTGTRTGSQTARGVAQMLMNFGVEVPEEDLRLRNVAAVLVTARPSSGLLSGSSVDVEVASIGDARSLEGGILLAAPLYPGVGMAPVAVAQGPVESSGTHRNRRAASGAVRDGGRLLMDLEAEDLAPGVLRLRRPDYEMAERVARAIEAEFGAGSAFPSGPGAVRVDLPSGEFIRAMPELLSLSVGEDEPTLFIRRDGQGVSVSGDVRLREGGGGVTGITVTVYPAGEAPDGDALVAGDPISRLLDALSETNTSPASISALLESLHSSGMIQGRVLYR